MYSRDRQEVLTPNENSDFSRHHLRVARLLKGGVHMKKTLAESTLTISEMTPSN
jgi:hypothetical protein